MPEKQYNIPLLSTILVIFLNILIDKENAIHK